MSSAAPLSLTALHLTPTTCNTYCLYLQKIIFLTRLTVFGANRVVFLKKNGTENQLHHCKSLVGESPEPESENEDAVTN